MHSKLLLAVFALFVPLVASTFTKQPDCKKNQFWWKDKKCCLPTGGQPNPPSPPKGSKCPPSNYQWSNDRGCCVPKYQPPPNNPPPQCPSGWTWTPALWRCSPIPTPPTPPPSNPSPKPNNPKDEKDCDDKGKPKNNKGPNGHRRRDLPKSRQTLCPTGLDACPVSDSSFADDYECVDYATELEFCGGCTTLGAGQNCLAIEGAWNVGCDQGTCVVYTCAGGFEVAADGKSCVPL